MKKTYDPQQEYLDSGDPGAAMRVVEGLEATGATAADLELPKTTVEGSKAARLAEKSNEIER